MHFFVSKTEENFKVTETSDLFSKILFPMNFPSDVYKWMKINAKPKMALKLMKVCKYFRHSDGFPYLVAKKVSGGCFRWYLDRLDGITFSTNNLETITKKLWIIEIIDLFFDPRDVSTSSSKTVVCNIRKLILSDQQITLDEFKLVTDGGMVERCVMFETHIISENGEMVPLEDIFECLPNAREIDYRNEGPSISFLEAADAKISSKLEKLTLWLSTTDLDIQPLFAYMKNHQQIHYRLWLWGDSTDEFKENLAATVKKTIQGWSPEYKEPEVFHP